MHLNAQSRVRSARTIGSVRVCPFSMKGRNLVFFLCHKQGTANEKKGEKKRKMDREREKEIHVPVIYQDQDTDPDIPPIPVPAPECSRPAKGSTTNVTSPIPRLLHLRGSCISRWQRGHFYPLLLPCKVPSLIGTPELGSSFPPPLLLPLLPLITLGGLNAFITRPFSL